MGKKLSRKIFAVVMSLALVLTSGLFAFADSPTVGKVSNIRSTGNYGSKTLTIQWNAVAGADSYKLTVGSKTYTVSGTTYTVRGLSSNATYDIRVAAIKNGVVGEASSPVTRTLSKRWMMNTKIKKVKSGKKKVTISWKKVKGATMYQIWQYKGGKWTVVKTVGKTTKTTIKGLSKGKHSFEVRPIKGAFLGIRSPAKTGKAK